MATSDSPQHQASLAIEGMSLSEPSNNNDIEQIKVEYKSCVDTEELTPRAFVTERIRGMLFDLANLDSQEKKKMEVELIEATVQPCSVVLSPPVAVDKETIFRNTEAQMLVRLQLWARLGDTFVRHYRKLKLSRKKKRGHRKHTNKKSKDEASSNLLLSDICDLFSMLAMKLPQSRPFSTFLGESLDNSLYDGASKLPKDLFSKVYQHFEILDPSAKAEEYFDFATAKPRRPKRKESAPTASSSRASDEKSSQAKGTNSLEKQKAKAAQQGKPKGATVAPKINLLAPSKRRNSLLGDGATQFVGSHFNTTLTNMSSLFREVSAGKQQNRVPKPKKPVPPRPQQRGKLAASVLLGSNHDQIPVAAGKRKNDQCFQVPVKKSKPAQLTTKRVDETPLLPRKKAQSRVTIGRVEETPMPSRKKPQCFQVPQSRATSRQVEETPVLPRKKSQSRVTIGRVEETPVPSRKNANNCFQMPQGALAVQKLKPSQPRVTVGETPVPHRQRPSAMLDLHAARKVVVEARNALKRQK